MRTKQKELFGSFHPPNWERGCWGPGSEARGGGAASDHGVNGKLLNSVLGCSFTFGERDWKSQTHQPSPAPSLGGGEGMGTAPC